MKTPYYVGLDVGGSAMKAGVVDDSGTPLGSISLPTEPERGQELGLERMCEAIREAVRVSNLSLDDIDSIGVATPGLMDIPAGLITDPPNLKPWRNVPVRDHIAGVFGKPTAFQNDANAAALGEYWAGAGRGVASLVFYTLGTGIGGGIVLDGKILEGRHSHGAELGHLKIEMTRPRQCTCGRFGWLEAYASAVAVVKRALEAIADRPSLLHERLKTQGELTARDVFDAADQGDEPAARVVEETAYYLALGAMNAMHAIDPDMVVFGGGMIAAGEGFLERIRQHVRELAFPIPAAHTEIRYAKLGIDAGFIGAAACGRMLTTSGRERRGT